MKRGGSWNNDGHNLRSAKRNNNTPGNRNKDGILEGETSLVAHPVGEEEGGLAGIHDEGGVGTGIGQTEGHVGARQHVQHLVEVLVQDRPCEDPPSVHLD